MINVIRFQKSRFLPPNGISKNFWHLTSKYVQSSCNTNVKCKNNYFRRKKSFRSIHKKIVLKWVYNSEHQSKAVELCFFSTIKTNFSIVFISDYALMTCLFLWATLRHLSSGFETVVWHTQTMELDTSTMKNEKIYHFKFSHNSKLT